MIHMQLIFQVQFHLLDNKLFSYIFYYNFYKYTTLDADEFYGSRVEHDLDAFKKE